MGRTAAKFGLLALLMLLPLELTSCVGGNLLAARGVVYRAPGSEGYARYLERRDPLLGWPSPASLGGEQYDSRGARRVGPGAADPAEPPCMAVFGDSFTFGDEVEAEEAYAEVLGAALGCRVANYGVGGYGSDQALLRHRHRFEEPAQVVLLAHYTENVIRNVNRYRGFLTGGGFGWKPRFVSAGDGPLTPLDLPTPAEEELPRFGYGDPLEHEYFTPGGPAGIVALRFPYTLSMLRVIGQYRVRAALRGELSYAPFYRPEHPSGAMTLTADILETFVRDARARGQRPLVMVIPDERDLVAVRGGEPLPYEPLLEELARRGIETPRLADALLAGLGEEAPCALYLSCGGAHMNPRGHRAIADALESIVRPLLR